MRGPAGMLGVARYERILLMRTTRYRVLGGIGLAIPLFVGIVLAIGEARGFEGGTAFGVGAFVPFFIYSFLQTIVIAFVAGDFRAADVRAHVHEVLAVRPLSTFELVAGKYLGVVQAMASLSLVVLAVTMGVQAAKLSVLGTPFRLTPYLGYLLLMNLPGLLYMTALTFFLGAILRNRTAAALVVMAYAIVTVFFLAVRYGGLFDFGAFHAPLFYSDMLGFGDLRVVVAQRGFYVALAVVLIALSVERYPRLPQRGGWGWIGRGAGVVGLIGVVGLAGWILREGEQAAAYRSRLLTIQASHAAVPAPQVLHYDLDVHLMADGAPLAARAAIRIRNPGPGPMPVAVFTLNPGLELGAGLDPGIEREGSVVRVPLSPPLAPRDETLVELEYTGAIDTDGFDLIRTAPGSERSQDDDIPKMPELTAWIRADSAFLPPRSGWYPSPGVDYGHAQPIVPSFFTARIEVSAPEGLEVVSQGMPARREPDGRGRSRTRYSVDRAVPALSLNAGRYEVVATEIGDVELALYAHPEHTHGIEFLADAIEPIREALEQLHDALERETGLPYPYQRLAVVEVPFLVQWYYEGWREVGGLTQPGVLMIEEDRFTETARRIERDHSRLRMRSEGDFDSGRTKRDLLLRHAFSLFLSPQASGLVRSPLVQLWSFDRGFVGERASLLERGMPVYLQRDVGEQVRAAMFQEAGRSSGHFAGRGAGTDSTAAGAVIADALDSQGAPIGPWGEEWDRMLDAMQQRPFGEMRPDDDPELYREILDTKGLTVFRMMRAVVGTDAFVGVLGEFGEESRYESVSFDEFERAVAPGSDEQPRRADLDRLVGEWLGGTGVPGYTITRATARKVESADGAVVHQVVVRVRNGEPALGFVEVKAAGFADEVARGIQIEGGTEVEVALMIADRPSRVTVEPFFAKNRRALVAPLRVPDVVSDAPPETWVRLVPDTARQTVEIIVDNEDEGFSMPVRRTQRFLRPGMVGDGWSVWTTPFAFGRYETNFRFKGRGDGAQPAIWTATMPRSGQYDVAYYFLPTYLAGRRVGMWGVASTFDLMLRHGGQERVVRLETAQLQAGWNLLGRYTYEAGDTVSVELSDRADGRVYADAVRWRFFDPDHPELSYEEGIAPWELQGSPGSGGGR